MKMSNHINQIARRRVSVVGLLSMKKLFLLFASLALGCSAFGQGVSVNYYAVGAAVGATGVETAVTLTKSAEYGANTSAASFVIGTGKKRYHVTSMMFATRGNATGTAQVTTFNIRVNTAGAVTTSSTPIVIKANSGTPATSLAYDRVSVPLPIGGLELLGDGTAQFGVTVNSVYVTNAPTVDILIDGYEY